MDDNERISARITHYHLVMMLTGLSAKALAADPPFGAPPSGGNIIRFPNPG